MTEQQTSSGAGADRATVDRTTQQIEQKFEQLRGIQSAMKAQLGVAIAAIVVIMLVFGMSTYRTVTTNFEPQKMTDLAMERASALQPMVQQKLVNAALAAVPTYRDLVEQRLPEVMPRVRDNAQAAVALLPQQLHDDLLNSMKQMADRVAMQVKGDLKDTFPGLTDATTSQALGEHLGDAVDRETQQFLQHVNTIFEEETTRVADVVLRFKVPPTDGVDPVDLQRQVLHHALLLADYELMADDGLAEALTPVDKPAISVSVE